jgi:hypothetical protein
MTLTATARRPLRASFGVLALLLGTAVLPSFATGTPVSCGFADVSLDWSAQRTVVCANETSTGLRLDLSHDGGRTWTTRTLVVGIGDYLQQVALSPGYEADHTIYARYYQSGLYRSTDDGATMTLIDPLGSTHARAVRMSPLPGYTVAAAPLAQDDAVLLGQQGPVIVVNGLRQPVTGAGDQIDLEFLTLDAGRTVLDVSEGPNANLKRETKLSLCTTALSCPDRRVVLPPSLLRYATTSDARPGGSVAAIVAADPSGAGVGLWVTGDRGRTFARSVSIQPVLDHFYRPGEIIAALAVVGTPAKPVLALRVAAFSSPTEAFYRSADLGRSWQRVTPSGLTAGRANHPWMFASPTGTLFSIDASSHLRWSTDAGAHWTAAVRS